MKIYTLHSFEQIRQASRILDGTHKCKETSEIMIPQTSNHCLLAALHFAAFSSAGMQKAIVDTFWIILIIYLEKSFIPTMQQPKIGPWSPHLWSFSTVWKGSFHVKWVPWKGSLDEWSAHSNWEILYKHIFRVGSESIVCSLILSYSCFLPSIFFLPLPCNLFTATMFLISCFFIFPVGCTK